MENCFVACDVQGLRLRGTILRLERCQVSFELYHSSLVLRSSEVLDNFKIHLDDEVVYSDRALVTQALHTGAAIACEAKLVDPGAQIPAQQLLNGRSNLLENYARFIGRWQKKAKVPPEFKTAVLDLHTYLCNLKLLLEQIEVCILAHPSTQRSDLELWVAQELSGPVLADINALHEQFEAAAGRAEPDQRDAYQTLVRRLLHPLFLCSPFGYRTYQKPLGYAGDYEIMNMIHRNTFEGASLYAKMVHYWLVKQWAAESVRNRVAHLKACVSEETLRVSALHRAARIMNLGCGPVHEVEDFIAESPCADAANFTLVDFDVETLEYVNRTLTQVKKRHGRRTGIETRRLSASQLLKFSANASHNPLGSNFDLIYCGGIFDYLSDRVCRQLVGIFYDCLAPGGRLVVANMHDRQKPFRYMLEFLLDWHLIYRDTRCMASFRPQVVPPDNWSVIHEPIAANQFLEIRKPTD